MPESFASQEAMALRQASALFAAFPQCLAFSEYIELRNRGLRKNAFVKLDQFLLQAQQWSEEERRRFVDVLMTFEAQRLDLRALTPEPLLKLLVRPTLDRWIVECPENPVPWRWRGSPDDLRRAIQLDPKEQVARQRLADHLCYWVRYAVHHLPDYFIGTIEECMADLSELDRVLSELDATTWRASMLSEYRKLRETVEVYQRYTASLSDLSFSAWLDDHPDERARCIDPPRAYYYDP